MVGYRVNEIFCSPQGEGARRGDQSVFIRFTGCNMRCDMEPGKRSPGGFACDTEFISGNWMRLDHILDACEHVWRKQVNLDLPRWVVLTGGEPLLQVDDRLVTVLHAAGWKIQIETNGSLPVPEHWNIDWLTVSPKVAEHALKVTEAHEVKYVRGLWQALPKTRVHAERYFISPAADGNDFDNEVIEYCKQLIAGDPKWELSVQMHKVWDVR